MFRISKANISELYQKLGQFQYNHSDFASGPIRQSRFAIDDGAEAIYVGQLIEETEIKEGIGIAVYNDGRIYEGYWKDDDFE